MAEVEFTCVCNDPDKNATLIQCVMCSCQVHADCYQLPLNKAFYCEECLLQMHDPLIGMAEQLRCEPLVDNSDKKLGLLNIELKLNEKQVQELQSGESCLNFYVVQMGHLIPTFDNLQIMIDKTSLSINTDRYNLIPSHKLDLSFGGHRRTYSVRIKVFLNEPDIKGKLYITLANKLDTGHLTDFVTQKKASQLQSFPLDFSWRALISQSKVSAETSIMNLLDPLTLLPMKQPGKGLLCQHPGFFCLDSYLKLNLQIREREKQWCCPICSKRVYYQELFWDDDLQKDLDRYKKNHPSLMQDSSTSCEDDLIDSKPQKPSAPSLPKFKLYLHKGQVCNPLEIAKLAPWVLRHGNSSQNKVGETLKPLIPEKEGFARQTKSVSKADTEIKGSQFLIQPLQKRTPREAEEPGLTNPVSQELERSEYTIKRKPTSQSKESVTKKTPHKEPSTPAEPEKLPEARTGNLSTQKSHPIQTFASSGGHLEERLHQMPMKASDPDPPVRKPTILRRYSDDSVGFLNDSSEMAKESQATLSRPIVSVPTPAADAQLPDTNNKEENLDIQSSEHSKSKTPFRVVRDHTDNQDPSQHGAREILRIGVPSGYSSASKASVPKRQRRRADSPEGNSAGPTSSRDRKQVPVGKRSKTRTSDISGAGTPTSKPRSMSLVRWATPGSITPAIEAVDEPDDPKGILHTASPNLETNLQSKPTEAFRPSWASLTWSSQQEFTSYFERWVARLSQSQTIDHLSGELTEELLDKQAESIIQTCRDLPQEEFHHNLLLLVTRAACAHGYEVVGLLLGRISYRLHAERAQGIIQAFLQMFVLRRYGLPHKDSKECAKSSVPVKSPLNRSSTSTQDRCWLSGSDTVSLVLGLTRSIISAEAENVQALSLRYIVDQATTILARFLSMYHFTLTEDQVADLSNSEAEFGNEQILNKTSTSEIIDLFCRQLTSVLVGMAGLNKTQALAQAQDLVGHTVKKQLRQMMREHLITLANS